MQSRSSLRCVALAIALCSALLCAPGHADLRSHAGDYNEVKERAREVRAFLAHERNFVKRGVVIAAGGRRLLLNALVTARIIREHHKSKLPILVTYCTTWELHQDIAERLLATGGVTLRDACDDVSFPIHHYKANNWPGWVRKVIGIYSSHDLDQILFLDADSTPLVKPEELFEDPKFEEHGSLFWPDFQKAGQEAAPQAHIYELFNLEPPWKKNPEWRATESAQFLLDRRRHDDVMEYVMMLNLHYNVVYRHVYGDKDLYEVAFALAEKSGDFQKIPIWPRAALTTALGPDDRRYLQKALVHNNREGKPVILHRSMAKLSEDGPAGVIAYVTSLIGSESFHRFHYSKEPFGRVIDEAETRPDLNCTEMDEKTVHVMHEADPNWEPQCRGTELSESSDISLIPVEKYEPYVDEAIKAIRQVSQGLDKVGESAKLRASLS